MQAYQASLRRALSGLVTTTLVLTAIWFVLSGDGFYWPVFVVLAASANLLRVLFNRRDLIEQEQRRLERKQRKRLESPPA